ncbi:hypothetical protein CISIN_1g020364mg [Citrus sinensis]|uniref:Protein kinase domain-containing protein n=1 Tax=Citrus sinensis TaxID=2711 RepID=A0A067F253_CITSI|nr:hypothetical protein CISIN_1g020364mg [Citrus sinensis]
MMISLFRRRNNEEKEKNTRFLRNGKILLERLIRSCNGKQNPIRGYSAEELQAATNNYDQRQVMAYDDDFKLYKGFLQDRPVSVMCFLGHNSKWAEEYCYNNIVFASQMSHKNVLKLIGCCLETEIPTLVFESVESGSLDYRIRRRSRPHFKPLLLAHRLKIAMEIANAVAYLHIGLRRPVVFRDIKLSHVLLDEQNTHIKDAVLMGTAGFVAPEYMMTAYSNEKCDVFSFGMLLLELLTGKAIHSLAHTAQDDRFFLLDYVKNHVENNRLQEIVDPVVVEDRSFPGKEPQLLAFVLLIFECVGESPADRPTMMDVAKKLRRMYLSVI